MSHPVRLACNAMATRFEFVLQGDDAPHLRAAGEEAIREIHRIAARFSFYDSASELSKLNREAATHAVQTSGELFALLSLCKKVYAESDGAFDPSVGPLMHTWGFSGGRGAIPDRDRISNDLASTGFDYVELDKSSTSVRFLRQGIQLDLGGVAKGWALDECALLLRESGISSALIHGGTSSVLAIGGQDNDESWTIGIEDPYDSDGASDSDSDSANDGDSASDSNSDSASNSDSDSDSDSANDGASTTESSPSWFTKFELHDGSLSVSAIHGKSFLEDTIEYGHVIDPRTGLAISGPLVSCVSAPSAALADAWSTACLILPDPLPGGSPAEAASFEKSEDGWGLRSGSWPGFK